MAGSTPWRTALVTGASSGIGRAFAEALAVKGTDVVLVARRADRLEELAAQIREDLGVNAEILAADLLAEEGLARVESRLSDASSPIDLLINNAGIGNTGPFAELPIAGEERAIELNVTALVRLTHAALPGMIERRRGGILNVSSMSALVPGPFGATYAGSKAFVQNFTESIALEVHGTGIRVTSLCPGFTLTEFHDRRSFADLGVTPKRGGGQRLPERFWMSAESVAETGLRALQDGKVVAIPGLGYRAIAALLRVVPRSTVRWFTTSVMFRSPPSSRP